MTAKITPEMEQEMSEQVTRVTTSQPAFIILRTNKGDAAAGPLEWDDKGAVEHRFPIEKECIVTGFDVCHGDGTPIYHCGEYKKMTKGDSYTTFLAVQGVSSV